jgi:MoaA/NifB/PqqE/SkfB family radical SAM enzyme
MAARRLLDEYGAVPLIQFATPIPATSASPRFDSAQGRRGGGESEAGGRGISSPLSSLGDRIQHAPSFLPESVGKEELQTAVGLLRRRAGQAACAKVIVNLTYRCNNHCLFCAVGNRLKEDLPLVNVREVLEKYRAQGIRQLDLDGGEPTLHPDLLEIIALAVRMGFAPINVTTNGRRLSYPDFARALLGSGIHSLLVSLHGPNSRVHERLTGAPGSFRETMAGIRNALAYRPASVDVGVNTTLSVENYALVEQLVEILFPLGVERFNLQFLTPFGRAAAEAVPKPEEAAAVVRSLIEKWKGRVRIQVINLPYCLLAGREDFLVPDLGKLSRNMVFVTRQEVNLYHYLAQCRKYDEKCASCLFAVACDGQYDFSEVQA